MNRKWLVVGLLCFAVAVGVIALWIQRKPRATLVPIRADTLARSPAGQMKSLRDTAAIPRLLRDSSWEVRLAAANALRDLTTLSPVRRAALLVETLDREAATPAAGPVQVGSYVPLTTSLRLQYLGLLEEIGSAGAEGVRNAVTPTSAQGRDWRVLALGAVEAGEAAPHLRELLINSSDPAVRMTAAHHLGWLKDSAAIPALQRALTDNFTASSVSDRPGRPKATFYPVRVKAARALRELGLKVERQGDSFTVR